MSGILRVLFFLGFIALSMCWSLSAWGDEALEAEFDAVITQVQHHFSPRLTPLMFI